MLTLLLFAFLATTGSLASKNNSSSSHGYCSSYTLDTNSSLMHFTKEPVPVEYVGLDKFKSIHCCVKGYRSIEWFKNGVSYPWSAGVSSLILYPEAANQTLYTRKAARSDSGNYTCRLSNETHSRTHTLRLDVLEKPTDDAPKLMFISPDQWVEPGSRLRLFCEAFIGLRLLADARKDLRWWRVFPNGTEGELLDSQKEDRTTREDEEDILGSYLTIAHVSAQDYGTFVCSVHGNNVISNHTVTIHYIDGAYKSWSTPGASWSPWRTVTAAAAAAAAALLAAALLQRRCAARLLLAARHARARAATPAQRARVLEKEFDVLVCFTEVDAALVRGVLLHTLAHKYNYRVHGLQLSTQPDSWYEELLVESSRSRALVAVLSPAQYSPSQLLAALRQLRAVQPPRAVALLQDLPKLKVEAKESGENLVALLRGTKLLPWRRVHDKEFWTNLRLALPTPPTVGNPKEHRVSSNQTEENSKSRSSSLTALV